MKKTALLSLLFSVLCLQNCVPSLKVDKICDLGDPAKYIREAFILRQTTNQEFYCSTRIRDRAANSSGTDSSPAPTISFTKTLYSGFQDEVYNITPTLGGGAVTSCTVAPTLPAGLSINATTCAITGTATTGGAGASYTITATNATGSATASTKIKVLGPNAFRVYGQNGSFTSSTINNGGLSASSLSTVRGVAVDSNDNVYIADSGNNRVLFFAVGSTTATRVYGQAGSYTTGTPNNPSLNANSLNGPARLAIDQTGRLFINDETNHRVLRYPANGSTTADFVYGQLADTAFNVNSIRAASNGSDGYNFPYGIAFDPQGNFYVADTENNRVLSYPSGNKPANFVYGQPNFTSGTQNRTQSGLSGTNSVFADTNNVFVGDDRSGANRRIMIFPKGVNSASVVLGSVDFTTQGAGLCNSNSVKQVHGMTMDSNGNLFAADFTDHRILIFKPPFTTNMIATYVLGQTSLTNFTNCSSAAANNRIFGVRGTIAFDSFGNLYVPEESNNRVTVF